jgi:hypothetical protein
MKHLKFLVVISILNCSVYSQKLKKDAEKKTDLELSTSESFIKNKSIGKLIVGGYGEVNYNEPDGKTTGTMDVHRMVILFGYNFSENVQFVTEIEYEHVNELAVEQAFINYNVSDNINVKAGLMLIPMGIINEYHEPTTFFGVERSNVDNFIVPSTWREIGIGISGKLDNASIKYQAYLFNGFNSSNLRGIDGLRKGRQKGAKSKVSSAVISAKLDYYGIKGLRLGLAGYFGDTYTEDNTVIGSNVGISMIGFDARYTYKKFKARAEFITASISDVENYNMVNNSDLGKNLQGWFVETAYNLLSNKKQQKLYSFIRYEQYNTHHSVGNFVTNANKSYDRQDITIGLNYELTDGAIFKMDYQIKDDATNNTINNVFNMGIGVWF